MRGRNGIVTYLTRFTGWLVTRGNTGMGGWNGIEIFLGRFTGWCGLGTLLGRYWNGDLGGGGDDLFVIQRLFGGLVGSGWGYHGKVGDIIVYNLNTGGPWAMLLGGGMKQGLQCWLFDR